MTTFPNNIEQKIDFTFIREELRRLCHSSLGRERVDEMVFLTDFDKITHLLAQAKEMLQVEQDATYTFPKGEIHDIREAVARIRIEGLFLDETELFQLRKILDYACQVDASCHQLDPNRFPYLRIFPDSFSTEIHVIHNIVMEIDRILDRYGRLADNASPELGRIRHELVVQQGSVGRALTHILHQAQADGLVDKDVTPTLREGRLVIPVPPAYKRKIGGIVHDESATGKTVYIEPQQVVEANNRIRELESEERRERARILQVITNQIRPFSPQILISETMLAEVDFLRAKALLAQHLHAIFPELRNEPWIDWREARHPVLFLKFQAQGKSVVPLSIRLRAEENRILVISGPNAGGKSVCLKTVALLQYMLQCGLLIPLAENSQAGIFQQLMIDIGDEQSIEDDLSTYSSHLRNMKAFVCHANPQTLTLIDEFGTGTEPLIGGAMAEAVLTRLVQSGCFGVITTHYTNLKHFAEQTPCVVNGAMLYDRGRMCPLFQLSIGQAGSSFAVEIAQQIGMPRDIIEHASQLIGQEHIDYDKQLQDIARDKRYWADKRQAIRQREKQLEEQIAHYQEEMAGIKAKKREIIDKAKQEAAEILQQSNATIERTICEIKEAKADKEKTKQARQRVENMKRRVTPTLPTSSSKEEPRKPRVMHDFKDLRGVQKEMPSSNPIIRNTIRQRVLSFNNSLDLRGQRVDEALETFVAYLDDAIMVNAGQISILHGTGTGAIKQVVREHLQNRNRQLRKRGLSEMNFHDGDPDRGGAGITIVEL